jgi:hypothetical protein
LVVIGIIGIMVAVLWKKRINPIMTESDGNDNSIDSDSTTDKRRYGTWKR